MKESNDENGRDPGGEGPTTWSSWRFQHRRSGITGQLNAPEAQTDDRPDDVNPRDAMDDVVARIREILTKEPGTGSKRLFEIAVGMQPSLEEAGLRSFHARYVLPLKREQARAEGRIPARRTRKAAKKQPPARTPAASTTAPATAPRAAVEATARARVRDVLTRLARDIATAESRAQLVDALARVDRYVDELAAPVPDRGTTGA